MVGITERFSLSVKVMTERMPNVFRGAGKVLRHGEIVVQFDRLFVSFEQAISYAYMSIVHILCNVHNLNTIC